MRPATEAAGACLSAQQGTAMHEQKPSLHAAQSTKRLRLLQGRKGRGARGKSASNGTGVRNRMSATPLSLKKWTVTELTLPAGENALHKRPGCDTKTICMRKHRQGGVAVSRSLYAGGQEPRGWESAERTLQHLTYSCKLRPPHHHYATAP